MLFALLALVCLGTPPTEARGADLSIEPGSFKVRMLDSAGNQEDEAGSHPDRLQIDFGFELESSDSAPRDLVFDLPPGFAGNPGAVPECPLALFESGEGECPPESQVGLMRFTLLAGQELELPVFALEPAGEEVLAFSSQPATGVKLAMQLRTGDFGITLQAADLAKFPITEGHAELWGVPADHQQGTTITARPLLTAPTRCGPLAFTFRTRSWEEGAPWLAASTEAEAPLVDCQSLAFRPTLGLQLDNPIADSPSGLLMEVGIPTEAEPPPRADAQIKDATIELPDGVTVSPGGAGSLAACSEAQLGLGSSDPARCPESSRVGTVELSSSSLPEPLTGTLYLGDERPGERFRLFVVAQAPGAVVKFVGAMQVDPLSGRLSAQLRDLPQAPIENLRMVFAGGPDALLATPLSCGSARTSGSFTPYGDGPTVHSVAEVEIGGRSGWLCPGSGPFEPRLLLSSGWPVAGRLAPFSTTLLREAGEQVPRRFSIALPPGLSAALGTVELCPEQAAASASCPAASRIGTVLASAGSGQSSVALPGEVYLTGPYRHAPFGLSMQLRAAFGPFDLGKVGFRGQVQVSARSGRVTVLSDALPGTIEGVPVRLRSIELSLDRPGLIRNPTACGPAPVEATIEAGGGATAAVHSALALRGCRKLGLRPRFNFLLSKRGTAQTLRVSARPRRGDTNLRAMRISLPKQLRFDVARLEQICSRYEARADECPPGSRVGSAIARTELLGRPMRGSVYVAQPSDWGLPDLWVSLGAMGVRFTLQGHTVARDGRIVTQLPRLPDMPLSELTMWLGGANEVFSLAGGLCKGGLPRRFAAGVRIEGQDGSEHRMRLPVDVRARCR